MGWAPRWLRGLLGGGGRKAADTRPVKEKKRWGFGKSFREKPPAPVPARPPTPTPPSHPAATPRRGYAAADEAGDEQSKRAIAVAAATAAVAEAAVAAAQAAAAVVRLTSSGRCAPPAAAKREQWAAVRIQAAFRGYLARRALKALRGLVKLQALVRGNIVRRQAAETLRCMHALVRVQARARACRAIRSQHVTAHPANSSRTPGGERLGLGRERSESCGRNWLDRWVEERYMDDEKNAKILEVDNGKPGRRYASKRRGGGGNHHQHHQSPCSTTMGSEQNSRSYATMPESPSKDSTTAQQSVPSPASVGMAEEEALSPLRVPVPADVAELCDSPQFFSATSSRPGSSRRGPFTPTAKSECSRSLFGGYSDYPNYMANTESFRAKARSQSAPKQRPQYERSSSLRRASAAQRSAAAAASSLHAKFTNKAYPGSGRLDRLGLPARY
ncbi:hypothetical protein Zm00014a_022398 [Zea mays]|uniref:DUF4005 domain-containing protein n=1 Tax=Zea mays TaxID=4577 RepID=A0A3L6G8X8_MAIZE|nr:hypothetical protein Zm00014a_022398 [Zea mays]